MKRIGSVRRILATIVAPVLLGLLAACVPTAPISAPQPPRSLVVATHDSFAIGEEIVAAFEAEHNATVQFLALGDTGSALNKMILSRDAPLADVFFGVDNTFLSRALEADIFIPYASPLLQSVPDELKLDPEHRLLPIDFGFVTLNADAGWYAERNLPLPATLDDLTDPAYAGQLVVQNPATSSPGLAFLIATIGAKGEAWPEFWAALRANDVRIVDGWTQAYYEHFTVGSGGGGDRPLVVSYSTSPPADVLFAADGRTEPASVNINLDGGVFKQVEFAGIVRGTQNESLAQKWIDAMLALPFQEDLPLQMFVYPANQEATLPELFVRFAEAPANAVAVPPAEIDAQREVWLDTWSNLMLR